MDSPWRADALDDQQRGIARNRDRTRAAASLPSGWPEVDGFATPDWCEHAVRHERRPIKGGVPLRDVVGVHHGRTRHHPGKTRCQCRLPARSPSIDPDDPWPMHHRTDRIERQRRELHERHDPPRSG
jgi:hypothetical protein